MKKYFEVLRKCPLFENIEDDNLSTMLGCLNAKVKDYAKNELIFAEASPARYIGILLSGRAQIERTDYYGNRSILTHIDPSELFGESFACADASKIPIDVVATEDCEVILIDCSRFIDTCSNACSFHQQMIYNLLKIVATKNILLNQKAEITAKRTTREKLMAYLSMLAKKNSSNSFSIPFDRQQLADFLEVDRSGLSAEISKLRSEGVLECKKNMFKLLIS